MISFHPPSWDEALRRWLTPYDGLMNLMLVGIIGACLFALYGFRGRPDLKALFIAWIVLP